MDDEADAKQATEHISSLTYTHLRKEFPFMKLGALDALVKRCSNELMKGIAEQQPSMKAAKSRTGFMSLSAELRNDIYWLVMKPDPEDALHQEMYRWLDDDKPAIVVQSPYADKYGSDEYCDTHWWFIPPMTQVSRQVRAEALPIYYGNIEFRAYGCDTADTLIAAHHRLNHPELIKRFCVFYYSFYVQDKDLEQLKHNTIKEFAVPSRSVKVFVRKDRSDQYYESVGMENDDEYIEV